MKFIDLFAGIGGFHLGLQRAVSFWNRETSERNGTSESFKSSLESTKKSVRSSRDQSNNFQSRTTRKILDCVYSNEWNKYAADIYTKHFGYCDRRDITTIDAKEIPDHDLLCGGFPCQAFSIAGKREGFNDTRGTLFFDIARILKEKQPRLCLLENVKGLLSHDNGRTFKTIISSLDELGYDLQWQVLNSKNFGVPQNRERVFIIGHLRGTTRPEVFPIRENDTKTDKVWPTSDRSERNIEYSKSGDGWPTERHQVSMCIDTNYWKGIDNHKQRTLITIPQIRRLTPIECERLQGFPDNWTEGFSDTQRYKCLGNAVTVNVVEEVAKKLFSSVYRDRTDDLFLEREVD